MASLFNAFEMWHSKTGGEGRGKWSTGYFIQTLRKGQSEL